MAVIQINSRITRREDVTEGKIVARCHNHGQSPKVQNVYTGKKREKFQGAIVECPCSDDCVVFSYTADDAVRKWNAINFLTV